MRANLPLISVQTDDTINLKAVLSRLVGEEVNEIQFGGKNPNPFSTKYSYILNPRDGLNYDSLYRTLAKSNKTLVLVNSKIQTETMFNVGVVPLPKEMLHEFLIELADDNTEVKNMMTLLGGLSLKAVGELCMLAMAECGELTT